jgi:glycosyltransferase involved in cell wall biosynthesis
MINFVSNLPRNLRSGGFSAMNAAAFAAVQKVGAATYVGPINPPVLFSEKAWSKLRRLSGAPGNFYFFSQQRLVTIADEVNRSSFPEATIDFFHGFTPWIQTRPARPYLAWSDCAFHDYIDVYHCRAQFEAKDLWRIERAEAAWLRNASRVIFTSAWAAERTRSRYSLDECRVAVVGTFGEVDLPHHDSYRGSKTFAFISTDFDGKGGRTVLEAFRKVRSDHPDASLVVVGDRGSAKRQPGVEYIGFLRKEKADERAKLCRILGEARAIVHPTTRDMSPLLLVEAGYYGCPAITSRRFAIPELVEDGRTGFLLEDPTDVRAVIRLMVWMLTEEGEYRNMRRAVWNKSHEHHSKSAFEARLHQVIQETSAPEPMPHR